MPVTTTHIPRSTAASFDVDEHTAALLTLLQKKFGAKTNAEVLRKAVALANVASQQAGSDNAITITGESGKSVKVLLDE